MHLNLLVLSISTKEHNMTDAQATRTAAMFAEIAREPLDVEQIRGTVYALGSELACLRLLAKYHAKGTVHNPKARVGYSANKQRWFFALDK